MLVSNGMPGVPLGEVDNSANYLWRNPFKDLRRNLLRGQLVRVDRDRVDRNAGVFDNPGPGNLLRIPFHVGTVLPIDHVGVEDGERSEAQIEPGQTVLPEPVLDPLRASIRRMSVVPESERWLQQPQPLTDLENVLTWAQANAPTDGNADKLLAKLKDET